MARGKFTDLQVQNGFSFSTVVLLLQHFFLNKQRNMPIAANNVRCALTVHEFAVC